MSKKKKTFVIASISLLVIIASGFGFVMITGACGTNSSFEQRFHRRGMPPFMQKEIGSFVLWRMDNGAKKLGLSETQQKQYNNFRSKLGATMDKGLKTKMEFKQQTMAEFEKENPNLAVITEKFRADVESISDLLSENLGLFVNFYNALDDKQKKIITEKIKERVDSHKNSYSCNGKEI